VTHVKPVALATPVQHHHASQGICNVAPKCRNCGAPKSNQSPITQRPSIASRLATELKSSPSCEKGEEPTFPPPALEAKNSWEDWRSKSTCSAGSVRRSTQACSFTSGSLRRLRPPWRADRNTHLLVKDPLEPEDRGWFGPGHSAAASWIRRTRSTCGMISWTTTRSSQTTGRSHAQRRSWERYPGSIRSPPSSRRRGPHDAAVSYGIEGVSGSAVCTCSGSRAAV